MRVRAATTGDVAVLADMRRRVEEWLDSLGIRQWPLGSVTAESLRPQVEAGEWFVGVDADHRIVAAGQYLDRDEHVWPDDPPGEARYVHSFMTNRGIARPGDGAHLLRWFEDRARTDGARMMRLDCVADNPRLRRFYRDQGYTEVGTREFDGSWYVAALFARALRPADVKTRLSERGKRSGGKGTV